MEPQPENNPITQSTNKQSLASPNPGNSINNTPQSDHHGITIAAMAIFVLLSLAAVGFLYYQNQQLKTMLAGYQEPTVLTPTPTPDLTVNWETYTSPSKDYLFKHPSGLKSDTGAAGVAFESIRFSFMGQKQIASGRTETELFDGYSFVVTKLGSVNKYDPQKEAQESYQNSKENCLSEGASVKAITTVKVNGNNAYQYQTTNCFGDYTLTFVSDGKNVFSISQLYTGDTQDVPGYKDTTDQILSTFKFTEATPSATPSL